MTQSTAPAIPTWTLSDRLRKAREYAGLEQLDLAERLGASRGTVSNYERGSNIRPLKPYLLEKWAAECGVDLAWLIGDDGPISRSRKRSTGEFMGTHRRRTSPFVPACTRAAAA